MKLYCPSCRAEIPADAINIAKGIGHCVPCNEIIDISVFELGGGDVPLVEKPSWSRLESFVSRDEIGIIIPPLGFRGPTLFFLFFTLLWNGISWTIFFAALNSGEAGATLFLIPFIAIGAITFGIFIYLLKAEVALLINRDEISLSRTVFGKSFNKTRAYRDLAKVSMVECYRQNNTPKYGIGLEFKNAKPIKFGSTLKEEEKQWILSEIVRFWKG